MKQQEKSEARAEICFAFRYVLKYNWIHALLTFILTAVPTFLAIVGFGRLPLTSSLALWSSLIAGLLLVSFGVTAQLILVRRAIKRVRCINVALISDLNEDPEILLRALDELRYNPKYFG
jgi:hypothetical protein